MSRPVNRRNLKTLQWEALRDSVTGDLCDHFNTIMQEWATSGDPYLQNCFVNAYIKILEFHKPRLSRTALSNEGDQPLVTIVIPEKL